MVELSKGWFLRLLNEDMMLQNRRSEWFMNLSMLSTKQLDSIQAVCCP